MDADVRSKIFNVQVDGEPWPYVRIDGDSVLIQHVPSHSVVSYNFISGSTVASTASRQPKLKDWEKRERK